MSKTRPMIKFHSAKYLELPIPALAENADVTCDAFLYPSVIGRHFFASITLSFQSLTL